MEAAAVVANKTLMIPAAGSAKSFPRQPIAVSFNRLVNRFVCPYVWV
jgi:hypothetical protein